MQHQDLNGIEWLTPPPIPPTHSISRVFFLMKFVQLKIYHMFEGLQICIKIHLTAVVLFWKKTQSKKRPQRKTHLLTKVL